MERLGINGGFLLAQIVNFVILALILWALVWKPLVKALETRRERIAKGLEDARAAEQRLAEASREADKLMEQRRIEANKLIEEARARSEEQTRALIEEAKREAEALRAKAREEALAERDKILGGVRDQVARIAIAATERLVGSLDEARAQAIVNDFLVHMPPEARGMGGNVEVISALPLTKDEQEKIKAETGAQHITFRVDPSILGGLVLRSGENVVDGSVRSNLQSLAAQML
ncbi:MAG: ATP synthase F0 subunit B [Candidatus Thermofonsia Clade 1 bacterium]|uniref:ATP synthase subunit b n=1 Tax=Candidatus Thermofonsia Clade 1 bacterium TaxID=2364210 RepID=A0A2M8PFK6_9CHLR|nr:MAG: ATP synthase F0 subunit B [Candidatus Thermofonsia Clade 1 bacterium]RMF53551.1 MAG: ATP synthase F0 subunit B [Chloroflexota bacterium]